MAATNRNPAKAVDLLYRLNVFPIELQALSERGEDVVLLAQHFLDELNRTSRTSKRFSEAALEQLVRQSWSGNVRELKNAVERAHILAPAERIDARHLPLDNVPADAAAPGLGIVPGITLAEAERLLILATLEKVGGSRKDAAEILGISPKTLYNRLKRYERGKD